MFVFVKEGHHTTDWKEFTLILVRAITWFLIEENISLAKVLSSLYAIIKLVARLIAKVIRNEMENLIWIGVTAEYPATRSCTPENRGYMATRLHRYMATRLHGYAAAWLND